MKEENWSSIRITEEELRDLHETKNLVEELIGKKIRLGEAISYTLKHLKSGKFESVDLKEVQKKIEVEIKAVFFGYHPPSLKFQVEIDNRNSIDLRIRQIDYRILAVGAYGFEYLPISVSEELEFAPVEKRTIPLTVPMDCYLMDLLHEQYEDGGYFPMISLSADFHFMFGAIGSGFKVLKEMQAKIDPKKWKHMIEEWKKRFPKTFREYRMEK